MVLCTDDAAKFHISITDCYLFLDFINVKKKHIARVLKMKPGDDIKKEPYIEK